MHGHLRICRQLPKKYAMEFIPEISNGPELPDLSDFSPSLIPEPARPLVLAPILLVKRFAQAVLYLSLIHI